MTKAREHNNNNDNNDNNNTCVRGVAPGSILKRTFTVRPQWELLNRPDGTGESLETDRPAPGRIETVRRTVQRDATHRRRNVTINNACTGCDICVNNTRMTNVVSAQGQGLRGAQRIIRGPDDE